METAKPTMSYRHEFYEIQLNSISEKKLAISVIDPIQHAEYYEKELLLDHIGVNTLIKAFEHSKSEITLDFTHTHISENVLLQITVTVNSSFLKPLTEIFFLKKIRDVSEAETMKKSIDFLSKKLKEIKIGNQKSAVKSYYGAVLQSCFYNGSAYETIASIKLPRGKYLITFSFLLKAGNQWITLYYNQGQSILPNSGFYSPNANHFMAHTLRKTYTVSGETEVFNFTTNGAASYPVTLKNVILVAKLIE